MCWSRSRRQVNCDHNNSLVSVSQTKKDKEGEEGAAEGEAPRCTSSIRGDGALFAAGIAAGLSHFLPSQTRWAGEEATFRWEAAQHRQTPNDPGSGRSPGSPSDARRTQQQPNSSSSGSGALTILMVGSGRRKWSACAHVR